MCLEVIVIIKIKNVTKMYGKKLVLDNISFSINDFDVLALIGENGSGKSTLAEIISGALIPDKGEVVIEGYGENFRVGYQYQENNWPLDSKVNEILQFYKNNIFISEKNYNYLSKIFEIDKLKKFYIKSLSGGERQRLNCLLAMINNPHLLILDEFFTGLDIRMQINLINFLKKDFIENKKTILIISHSPEEIEVLCNRVLFLKNGKLVNDLKINYIKEKFGTVRNLMSSFLEGEGY